MKAILYYKSCLYTPIIIAGIITAMMLSSCEDFIDVGNPQMQLSGETVFEDVATADAAMVHIYSRLQNTVMVTGDPQGLSISIGAYADELVSYSNYGLPDERFFTNNLLADDRSISALWSDSYNLIYATNAVYEGVNKATSLGDQDKKRLLAEALFVRCYIYYFLTNLFGDIPFATTTDYVVNNTLTKKGTVEIYELLINDLQQAAGLLPSEYNGSNRVRPNKETVLALLARVALASGRYDLAVAASSSVISQPLYTFSDNLQTVFEINCPGTLWQLAPAADGLNTLEAQNFFFEAAPPATRSLSNDLYTAFEDGDLRKTSWIGTVSDGASEFYYPNKYKLTALTGQSMEYSIQFRLEEQYLIRAEANARLGLVSESLTDLNVIRARAGLDETTAVSQQEALQANLRERRVEFFTEHGHRFFDLKRYNLADAVLGQVKPGWDATDVLLPLPQNELLRNRNLLPQNEGY